MEFIKPKPSLMGAKRPKTFCKIYSSRPTDPSKPENDRGVTIIKLNALREDLLKLKDFAVEANSDIAGAMCMQVIYIITDLIEDEMNYSDVKLYNHYLNLCDVYLRSITNHVVRPAGTPQPLCAWVFKSKTIK